MRESVVYVKVEDGEVVAHGLPTTGERWVDEPVMVEQAAMSERPVLDDDGEPTGEVEEYDTGQVVMVPGDQTQRVRATVSGFDQLPPEILADEGWLPLEDEQPDVPDGKVLADDGYEVLATKVKRKWRLEDAPPPPEPGPDIDALAEQAQTAIEADTNIGQDTKEALVAFIDAVAPGRGRP